MTNIFYSEYLNYRVYSIVILYGLIFIKFDNLKIAVILFAFAICSDIFVAFIAQLCILFIFYVVITILFLKAIFITASVCQTAVLTMKVTKLLYCFLYWVHQVKQFNFVNFFTKILNIVPAPKSNVIEMLKFIKNIAIESEVISLVVKELATMGLNIFSFCGERWAI